MGLDLPQHGEKGIRRRGNAMAIIHDDIGRRRFLSQAVMGFGMLFGMGLLGFGLRSFWYRSRTEANTRLCSWALSRTFRRRSPGHGAQWP